MTEFKVPFLVPIKNTTDITTEIIRRCEKILHDDDEYKKLKDIGNDFQSVIPYGMSKELHEEPYFNAKQVFKFVDITNDKYHIKHNLELGVHYIKAKITNDKKSPNNMLTREGLMLIMYMGKTKLAKTFQKYVFDLLDGLWKKHKEIMVSQMKITEKNLEKEIARRQDAETVNKQNIEIADAIYNTDNHEQNKLELNILRRKTMTRYYVYLVDWKFINTKYWKKYPMKEEEEEKKAPPKKNKTSDQAESTIVEGIDLNSSDDDSASQKTHIKAHKRTKVNLTDPHINGLDEYEFLYTSVKDLKADENEPYYMCVTDREINSNKESYKFMRFLYLDKGVAGPHYRTMIELLKYGEKYDDRSAYPNVVRIVDDKNNTTLSENDVELESTETPVKRVYKITYTDLINARDRGFINNHIDVIKDIKKEKRRS
jgi:prophage antirepressor-like protein